MRFYPRTVRLAALLVGLLALLTVVVQAQTTPVIPQPRALTSDGLATTAARHGSVRVIVVLRTDASSPLGRLDALPQTEQRRVIATTQQQILRLPALATAGDARTYENLPLLALTVDAAGLEALASSPLVEAVVEDGLRAPALAESTEQIGLTGPEGVWAMGINGAGWTVAILDTGIDKNHSFLTGKVVYEACYGTNRNDVDRNGRPYTIHPLCPGGVTSTNAPNSGMPCTLEGCDHGTHVAGIAAGKGTAFRGVAPEASIIAIQVFSRVNGELCGNPPINQCLLAADADILKGIDRVFTLKDTHRVAAINLSLSGGSYTSVAQCDADPLNISYRITAQRLNEAGIFIVAAAGNGVNGQGFVTAMGAPACVTGIVSVSSVGAPGQPDAISTFANRASYLDLLAPGYDIVSSIPGTGFISKSGTSMATAHVTGALALLRQHTEGYNVSQAKLLNTLKQEGLDIPDGFSTHKRIRMRRAVRVLTFPVIPLLATPGADLVLNKPGVTFTWQAGQRTDRYRVRVRDAANAVLFREDIEHSACAETCSVTTSTVFPDNSTLTWDVIAFNAHQQVRSAPRNFRVDYPGAPRLVAPADNTVVNEPEAFTTVSWTRVETAERYRVLIQDITQPNTPTRVLLEIYPLSSPLLNCDDETCALTVSASVQSALRDNHTYRWRVMAMNALGRSNSAPLSFRADIPGAPTLIFPANNSIINAPDDINIMRWSQINTATSYLLTVRNRTQPDNPVEIFRQVYALGNPALVCDVGVCTLTAPSALLDKLRNQRQYDWRVQARNNDGRSNSAFSRFRTDFPPPSKPGLTLPVNNAVLNDPSQLELLQWTNGGDAMQYRLLIEDVTNARNIFPILDAIYTLQDPELDCVGPFCTYLIADSTRAKLRSGHRYRWSVRADNTFGTIRSDRRIFTTRFPGKVTLQTPADRTNLTSRAQLTTMQWSNLPLANSYRVVVINAANGQRIHNRLLARDNPALTCTETTCTYTVPDGLRNALRNQRTYRWFVQSINIYGSVSSERFIFRTRF